MCKKSWIYPDKTCVGQILMERLDVEGANVLQGTMACGFPSLTAFVGFAHVLSRLLERDEEMQNVLGSGTVLDGVLVASHETRLHGETGQGLFGTTSLAQQRPPLTKNGTDAAIRYRARADLSLSLVVGVFSDGRSRKLNPEQAAALERWVGERVTELRIAGGPVYLHANGRRSDKPFRYGEDFAAFRPLLTDAWVLTDAHDAYKECVDLVRSQDPSADDLDAFLKPAFWVMLRDADGKVSRIRERVLLKHMHLVPITVGYQGIADTAGAGVVQGALDAELEFQFVEPAYTFGRWKPSYRINNTAEGAMWRHYTAGAEDLYLVRADEAPHNEYL